MRPDRFCNFIYYWYVTKVNDRDDFEEMLKKPAPREKSKPESAMMDEDQQAEWSGMIGSPPPK